MMTMTMTMLLDFLFLFLRIHILGVSVGGWSILIDVDRILSEDQKQPSNYIFSRVLSSILEMKLSQRFFDG